MSVNKQSVKRRFFGKEIKYKPTKLTKDLKKTNLGTYDNTCLQKVFSNIFGTHQPVIDNWLHILLAVWLIDCIRLLSNLWPRTW